ncbi:hypothetical protein BAUCODRAFT_520166 [Baudoinia panamericana UAMH 10762]|uniref:Uncharacterized protein n=1 Tax=Baudoinia panamericana (strain UAMH 10762) TaxID=717646 RepID=M2LKZ8_BAUPA|nr:uncharacterized protein BAUCODRAFT_520166 [Baudoinia panamericana UAMH 10762]EMC94957.1 hypothetical protein BAUCODRAFT_520166 [Baudoinia panamericana UAMH 10762]
MDGEVVETEVYSSSFSSGHVLFNLSFLHSLPMADMAMAASHSEPFQWNQNELRSKPITLSQPSPKLKALVVLYRRHAS